MKRGTCDSSIVYFFMEHRIKNVNLEFDFPSSLDAVPIVDLI